MCNYCYDHPCVMVIKGKPIAVKCPACGQGEGFDTEVVDEVLGKDAVALQHYVK